MTIEQLLIGFGFGIPLIALTGFLIKWNLENKRSLTDLEKHVEDTKVHDAACTKYQNTMTEKVRGLSGKVDSIEKMGTELMSGQAQNDKVMDFMRDISRDTKGAIEKTNDAIIKMGTSFDHLATVLDRMNNK